MLKEKCTENCIETDVNGISSQIPCAETINSDCIIIGEDMNLCSLNVKSETSIKKIIKQIDDSLCKIENQSISLLYNDLIVEGSCISKELIVREGKTLIKLGLNKECLCQFIEDCNIEMTTVPFIISATKYSICGEQKTLLTSIYATTSWYNQNGIKIGEGINKEITTGGNYYGIYNGKISNIVNIIYTAVCPTFTYTKIKNFYKTCTSPSVSTQYTYSKIYLSDISYQDALLNAESDAELFDQEGQAIINATGICIGEINPTPITPSCFNVFLSNVTCVVTPTPTPTPVPSPVPTPVPSPTPTPVRTDYWNLNLCSGGNATLQVDNTNLNAGIVLKDNVTGTCYITVNQGALVAPLLTNYYETGGDCSTCIATPIVPNNTVGTLIDLVLPQITQWNYFNPDNIPDFSPSKSLDVKTGELLPNKWFIWHTPYRNLFGTTQTDQLTKLFKKGITAINATKIGGYYAGIESIVTLDRIVGDAGAGLNTPVDDNYTSFETWATAGFGYASTYQIPTLSGKSRMFLNIQDYEGDFSDLTTQMSANLHTIGLWKGVSVTNGRVAFQYGAGKNSGSYATTRLYNSTSNNVWNLPADSTVPAIYQGKSAAGNNRIVGMFELAFTYEAFLPEGYQVKDQNNFDWFTISHFGSECNNTYGYNSPANANNWAAQLGTHCETFYAYHKAINQDVIAQIKPTNESDNGFHYSQQNAQYNQGRYIKEFYDNGITYLEGSCNCEQKSTLGSEYVTPFIAEGQVALTYFSGVKGINWWSSDFNDVAIPKAKSSNVRRGAKYNDPNYGNRDLESYLYTLKSLWRLNQKVTLSNGQQYSFNEICDGSEVYLNELTKVVYSTNVITQYRALDWQILKKTPVRAVVNVSKNVVFVLAFQAYGVEQNQITFKLTDYGANISEVISVPAGKIVIKAFPLTGGVPTPTPTPVPTPTPTPITPTPSGGTVIVTQPNKPQYYFSDGHPYSYYNPTTHSPLPAIYQASNVHYNGGSIPSGTLFSSYITMNDHYNAVDDIVYIGNSQVEFGINLKRGGQVAIARKTGTTFNYIYNGIDGGFQVQLDAYQRPDGYTQQGETAGSVIPGSPTSYNVVQGGDYNNNSVSLLDYHPVPNGFAVKFRPIHYPLTGKHSETYIEATYTLVNNALKCVYKYTSFRTDSQINTAFDFNGWGIPACFLNSQLTRYKIYTGTNPFSTEPLTEGIIPTSGTCATPVTFSTKEYWGMVFNPTTGIGFGVYNASEGGNSVDIVFKQCEVVSGNAPGTEFSGGFTFMQPNITLPNSATSGSFVKTSTAYITVGTEAENRNTFNIIRQL